MEVRNRFKGLVLIDRVPDELRMDVHDIVQETGSGGFPGGSDHKESACNTGDMCLEGPLEKGIAAHSSILTWRIPWTEEPGGLQSMSHKESDTTERLGHFHALTINTMRLSLWCFPTFAECVPLQWRDETLILPLTS